MSDPVLSRGTSLGSSRGFLELRGRSVQNLREGLCGLPRVAGRGRAGASSLCFHDLSLAAGDLALDRGSPPQPCRLLTLHGVFVALPLLCLTLERAGDDVALVRPTFTHIRLIVSPVGDPLALIRDPVALIGDQIALVGRVLALDRRLRAPKDRSLTLAKGGSVAWPPGALPFQGLVIVAKLGRRGV